MATTSTTSGMKAMLIDRLHQPMQLRAFVASMVFVVGYAGIYMPFESAITETTRQLSREQKRLELARDIEYLRAQEKQYQSRLPKEIDRNEWVEYVLSGIRALPLKMVTFDAKGSQEIGPFKVIVFNCEFEGAFHDMEQLLRWIEYNERFLRIDSVKISQHRSNNGLLVMQLVILGLLG